MPKIINREKFNSRRRELRQNQTDAEQKLWQILRGRQISGFKFKRQFGYGSYILDFYCHEGRLAIELDGGQHATASGYDALRTQYLNAHHIKVLRFWNNEVLQNHEGVLRVILNTLSPEWGEGWGEG
jgi:very-short-patch-repair endonuclease